MTSLNDQFPGLDFWEPHWQQFVTTYREWIGERQSESLDLFYIPPTVETNRGLHTLYGLSSAELGAEAAFASLCRRFHCCGVELCSTNATNSINRWINFDRLDIWLPNPEDSLVEMCRDHGWDENALASVSIASVRVAGLSDRLPSIIGRLGCHPRFRNERDELRREWLQLPIRVRPPFPLQSSQRIQRGTVPQALREELGLEHTSNAMSQFARRLDQFLEEWQLQSLETWELPKPQGPHWPDFRVSSDGHGAGTTRLSTPVRFPVLESDDIGRAAREQHQRAARECGIEDELKWRVYAELFRVGFWEQVLRQRYARASRARQFTTEMELVLGEIVGLSGERVRRLRRIRSSLISGSRTNLTGLRC